MLQCLKYLVSTFIVLMWAVWPAYAQTINSTPHPFSIAANGGLAAASRGNGLAAGGRLAIQVTDRLAIEVEGSRLGRGAGADGLSATASLLVDLLPADRKTVPYVAVGGGLYRASFDLDAQRFFGRLSGQFPAGTQMIPLAGGHGFGMMQGAYSGPPMWSGAWPGDTFDLDDMPAFYMNRLGQMSVPAGGHWGTRSFTDPAISVGGGVRLDVSPRLYVRPDARALIVIANGARYTVGVISVGVGYRF
jgi:hypothetical protein